MKLIATYPILYQSTQYKIGQELPASDLSMVEAWIEAGTAVWRDDDKEQEQVPKATMVSKESGVAGQAVNSEGAEDLVGKVPKNSIRKK